MVIVEAMKTEIAVAAHGDGTIRRLLVAPGAAVMTGQILAFLESA